ncbi:Crp/Fnr family transcriptional regulator [Cohnella cholangitidis]|uniref:Crp/Fnr family transcriptional regulator n=1 Tax=Cohnella cholangitidis TaxID=2598458 RepID=A0A7G5C3J6_9BACL|nr:Crp/Fnr family transcriptional regulator [Cohnella cholangitidis]QMV43780.1 Crp/Fnr family transcriptional regulator [Cohnella cholangitidis]
MPVDGNKLRASIPFFRDIEPTLIDRLIPYMHQKNYRKGELIFLEGDQGNEIYFIGSGSVSIYTFDKSKKVILAFLREGEYFGEMALMKPGLVRSATAECLMQTRLYSLRRTDFQLLIENDRNIAFHLLDYTMDRLRRANQQIYDLTFLNVRSRMIKKLLYMAEEYSLDDSNEFVIPVKITHQQLAEMVGAVRETVSKVLQEFQDEGLIHIQDKKVQLLNIRLLKEKLSEEV